MITVNEVSQLFSTTITAGETSGNDIKAGVLFSSMLITALADTTKDGTAESIAKGETEWASGEDENWLKEEELKRHLDILAPMPCFVQNAYAQKWDVEMLTEQLMFEGNNTLPTVAQENNASYSCTDYAAQYVNDAVPSYNDIQNSILDTKKTKGNRLEGIVLKAAGTQTILKSGGEEKRCEAKSVNEPAMCGTLTPEPLESTDISCSETTFTRLPAGKMHIGKPHESVETQRLALNVSEKKSQVVNQSAYSSAGNALHASSSFDFKAAIREEHAGAPAVSNQIVHTLESAPVSSKGIKELTMELNPKELGPIHVKLELDEGKLIIHIDTKKTETFRVLNENIEQLITNLELKEVRIERKSLVEQPYSPSPLFNGNQAYSDSSEQHANAHRDNRTMYRLQAMRQAISDEVVPTGSNEQRAGMRIDSMSGSYRLNYTV